MLNVFFTVDVEIWCNGWDNLDAEFPEAFQRYVYGQTTHGRYGLPYQLDRLKDYGFTGVFFVEPLFTTRFGVAPLQEITGLIQEANQQIQLHLHTEWVDEALTSIFPNQVGKRQFLHYFSLEEQIELIRLGKMILQQTGIDSVCAFRAGSFGFNRATLAALAANQIRFDSSYNAAQFGIESGIAETHPLSEPILCEQVCEYPLTLFNDGTKKLRPAQLTACSSSEMEGLLWQALERGYSSFVILSHNFELLNAAKNKPDFTVVKRFEHLLSFLDRHRDVFKVCDFSATTPVLDIKKQPQPLYSPRWKTFLRTAEQLMRKRFE